MKEFVNSDYEELELYAKSLDMTTEEYVLSLHNKNQKVKSVLLVNGAEYKQFVEEFHSLLDGMVHYKETSLSNHSPDEQDVLKKAVHILTSTSSDPKVLAQLFHHYPKGIDERVNDQFSN